MSASPAAVRAFATEQGLTVGARGRFSQDLVDSFNKGRRSEQKYVAATHVKTIKVSGTRVSSNGRKTPVTLNATHGQVRAAAQAAGVELGARGRIPASVLTAFASGTLVAQVATEVTA